MRGCFAILLLAGTAWTGPTAAGTWYVDNAAGTCSDAGPGTESAPFCTITAALNAHHAPGDLLLVKPGIYREQVLVPASGIAGSPLVIRATSPGVTVEGANDLSAAAHWTPSAGAVYLAGGVGRSPAQVFVDGVRLAPSTAIPAALPPNTFRYMISQGLYLNLGGDAPWAHQVLVGSRASGFLLTGRSYVVVDGFEVLHHEDRAIYVSGSATGCEIRNNRVRQAFKYGIAVNGASAILIASNQVTDNQDDGISVISGATGCTIENNESAWNVHPTERKAQGIELSGASGNVVRGNRLHHNQDAGEHLSAGSANNQSIQNRSWSNGDHGFDRLNSMNTLSIGDVAWGNYRDGFSNEGASPGGRMFDCIAVDNGRTTHRFDLWVDGQSAVGFVSDYNLFWNASGQAPVKFIATIYPTLAAYVAASGQDVHSRESDPRFVDAAGGDFHLRAGSPAIDAAETGNAGWPVLDAEGRAREDDPGTPDTGSGPVRFADRGALEYTHAPANLPPVAALTVTPDEGVAPLTVTADASGSRDRDGGVTSYRFDFGDGTSVGPQASPTAVHVYRAGSWIVRATALDAHGAADSTTRPVTVAAPPSPNLVGNPSFETDLTGWGPFFGAILARGPGGADGDYALRMTGFPTTASFGVNDSPNWISNAPGPGLRYRFTARVRSARYAGTARLRVREYLGAVFLGGAYSSGAPLSTAWQPLTLDWVTSAAGVTLDFQILDFPRTGSEAVLVDDVAIRDVTWSLGSLVGLEGLEASEPSAATVELPGEPPGELPGEGVAMAVRIEPNPVREAATLHVATSSPGAVDVRLFDLRGRCVRRLVERAGTPGGVRQFAFDGRGDDGALLAAGVYFYSVRAAEGEAHGRFMILR